MMNDRFVQSAVLTEDEWRELPNLEALADWDESKHPRDRGGKFDSAPSGGGSTVAISARAQRALAAYRPSTAALQRRAARTEAAVASALNGTNLDDNEPMDVIVKDAETGRTHGVEVKTLLETGHDRISCRPECRRRKEAWGRSNHATVHTVVADARRSGEPDYYYRRGVGAFRLGSMRRVTLDELRSLVVKRR